MLGLTLSVRAGDELADSIGTNAITIAKLLDNVSERHRAQTDDLRREFRCRLAPPPNATGYAAPSANPTPGNRPASSTPDSSSS